MARRYGLGADGNPHRLWGGKLPEEFSAQDVRQFMADTSNMINSIQEERSHMAKSTAKAAGQAVSTGLKLEARAYPITEPKGNTVAFASLNINDSFAVQGIKVINGDKGMFVSMPSTKDKNGDYRDIAFPITTDARKQAGAAVLGAYAKAVEKSQPELAAAARSAKEALEKPSLTGQLKDAAKESKAQAAPAKNKAAPAQEER